MTFMVDCDVLQADGGTRMASVTGSCVALVSAIQSLQYNKTLLHDPIRYLISGISVGMVHGKAHLDLSYKEDSQASTDMNVVMTARGDLIEVQSSAERGTLSREDFSMLLDLAAEGNRSLLALQKLSLGIS
jgi:ribonuclease PH